MLLARRMKTTPGSFASLLHLASRTLVAAVLPIMVGCAPSADGDEGVDSLTSPLTSTYGVDYAWARPTPGHLASQGYKFAVRYLSYDTTGKNLTASEASALRQAGIDVVSNWEWDTSDALGGFSRGVDHAKAAQSQALAAGMPAGRPIYFSVDFDAAPSQQPAIDAYFDGVASVLGKARTGAYGSYYVIKRLFDGGKITWGWQTYAWSGGNWDSRAQLRQVQNGIENGQLDKDEAVAADFGQWGANGGGTTPPAETCAVQSDGKLHCGNTVGAALYADHTHASGAVNKLKSANSWFDCWGTGEADAGGDTTWYHTLGDDNGNWGWIPAASVKTSAEFNSNPSAHGLAQCAPSLPPLPANCNVHSDGKLYCKNGANAAMYGGATTGSAIVNRLRSTSSWFTCWAAGQLHAGGNTTWYFTIGDDNGNWGWVPAVSLSTPSTFDANPSAYGLAHCK